MSSLTEKQRAQILDAMVETVHRKLYDPKMNGVDWPSAAAERRDQIVRSRDAEEFEAEVNELLKQLRVSHSGFFHESRPKASGKIAISATFCRVESREGPRWAFQDVHPGGSAHSAGIQPGDILLRVAGREAVPPALPVFPLGQETSIDLEKRDGRHSHTTIYVPQSKSKERPLIELQPVSSLRLEDSTGYLKVSMFPGAIGIDLARDLDTAIYELNINRLIVDLRGNAGGGIGCLRLMSYLTPSKVPVGYSLTRHRAESSFRKEDLPQFDRIPSRKLGLIPLLAKFALGDKSIAVVTEGLGPKPFQGRVVLLLNEHSASSSEMVAAFAAENQLATLVGEPTPGRLLGGGSFKVGHGYRVAIPVVAYRTWHDTVLEGRGVRPNIEVPFSIEAIRQGQDVQLNEAKRALQ